MTVKVSHQVPFHDVDSVDMAWHGHYYKYFELARTELYRSINLDIPDMQQLGYSFPVIESHCRYAQALAYGDIFEIEAHFKAWEYYLQVDYQLLTPDTHKRIAYGYTKQAVCEGETGTLMLEVPTEIIELIRRAL